MLKLVWKYFGFPILCTQQTKTAHFVTPNCTFFSDVCNLNFSSFHHPDSSAIFSSGRCPNLSPISGILQAKLYIPSTINNDYILWQHQLYDPKNMYIQFIAKNVNQLFCVDATIFRNYTPVHVLWYDILEWKLSKQTSYWSKTVFFVFLRSHNKFSSQNIVILSPNNVSKFQTKGHEQVFKVCNCLAYEKTKKKTLLRIRLLY